MNAKFFGALLAAPLAAVSAMIMAAPASAAVFFNGDSLNFSGGYKSTLSAGKFEFRNVGGTVAGIGSYGNFGILGADSTGDFSLFDSNNAIVAGNKILSVDFNDSTTYLGKDFLKVTNVDGTDSFTFVITGLASTALEPGPTLATGTNYFGATSLIGNFVSSGGNILGSGVLTNNFVKKPNGSLTSGSYSSTLTVTKVTVPEPSALLGLGLMVGTVFIIRRRQEVSA